MYIGPARLSLAAFPHYCTDPDVTWKNCMGCPLVVHYWAALQLVHGFRCYDNIAPNAKCQRVFVLALCLVITIYWYYYYWATVCKPFPPLLSDRCLSVCLS